MSPGIVTKPAIPRAAVCAVAAGRARDLARLRTLLPLRHLSDEAFAALVVHAEAETAPPGRELLHVGRDDGWLYFLIEGRVSVHDCEGDAFEIEGGSLEALYPLCTHPRARVRAVAVTAVRYFRLPSEETRASRRTTLEGIEVDEVGTGDDGPDHQLLLDIYQALHEDRLVLPSLPDVALRIRAAVEDERKGAHDVARIIQADPALAAYCVGIANSAAYAGNGVTGVQEAVHRMGLAATRDFVIAYSLRGLFKTREPRCLALMQAAWRHNANIGALCHVIARDVTRQNPEQAMLAGLLHDIGVMVIVAALPQHPGLLASESSLRTALRELKHQVTALVLRAWKLPDILARAAFAAEQWTREAGPDLDLCDTLLLAHWHQETRDLPWADPVPPLGAAALARLPESALTPEGRLRIVTDAREELDRLAALLRGS